MKKTYLQLAIFLWLLNGTRTATAQVMQVKAIGFTVRDMQPALKFYRDVLGFTLVSDREYTGQAQESLEGIFGLNIRVVTLKLGDEQIELTDYLTPGGRSIPEDMKSNDLYFQHIAIVVSDMEKAYAWLKTKMVMHVSTAPQTLPKSNVAAAGIKAFYFQDPDHHDLELIYFPKGKGQPKWQQHSNRLFLGIDHTAIGISNTDSSLHFYRDLLGLERKGDSWNMGMEQAHLNNIEGASLHITGLRAAGGPGIEFLQYLQPGPGKTFPGDSRADDIWHWQTTLIVHDASAVYHQLVSLGYKLVSKELVSINNDSSRAFIIRDPDGHALLIQDQGIGNKK